MITEQTSITVLSAASDAPSLAGLTYPAHFRAISSGEFPWLAVSAPGALALARIDRPGRYAELLSVFTAADERRKGLGSAVLSRLADELAKDADLERLSIAYSSRIAAFEAVEKTIVRAGLGEPFVRIFFGYGDLRNTPPWIRGAGNNTGEGWRMISWDDARKEGLDPLAAADRAGAPKHLSARFRESEINWKVSQMIFAGTESKGWFAVHDLPEKPDQVYYTKFWVQPDFAKEHRRASVLLLAGAMNTQLTLAERGEGSPFASFDTPLEYASWLRSLNKHLVPFLIETWTQRGLEFKLDARRTPR